MSGQASSGLSAYNQDLRDSRHEFTEHGPNEASGQQLLSYLSENQTGLPMEGPLFRNSENPMDEELGDHIRNWTAAGARNGRETKTLSHVSTKSSVHMWIVLLSALIPIIALAVWLIVASNTDQIFVSLAGSEIGGHFTQTQAKGVDFVCSALLAPLLFAGLNLIWFACARVCTVNESTCSVPLHTLATVSTLSRGTYDPFQYYAVLRGRTWRLVALGGIALCSALGSSALGNMIAYEVFNEDSPSNTEFSLRLLRDATIESKVTLSGTTTTSAVYGFSNSHFAVAAQGVSDLLNGLNLFPATLDEDNGYVGVNITSASMMDLDKSVKALSDVPGYRLSAQCVPGAVNYVQIWPVKDRHVDIISNITAEPLRATSEVSRNGTWGYSTYSYFSGQEDGIISVAPNSAFPTWDCGIRSCGDKFYIVYMMSGIHRQVLHTDYGDLQPAHQYKDDSDSYPAELDVAPTTYWGLKCGLYQQQGLINYTRSSNLQWSMAATSFDDNKAATSSQLSNWQRVKIDGDWAPPQLAVVLFGHDPLKPCLTGAEKCLLTRNVSHAVANYVYASGEITRIIHNVAAANASRATGHPEYYHNVTGIVNKQYYRITYVPVLLLVALVCIILAALLTTALMISVNNTVSWSWFRQVDVVRLVVDAVGSSLGFQDKQQFGKLSSASDDEIFTWAQDYQVQYIKVQKDLSLENEKSGHLQSASVQLVHEAKHGRASLGKAG